MANWYPGMESVGSFYGPSSTGYSPMQSGMTQSQPSYNPAQGKPGGQDYSTVAWGLGILAFALVLMHLTERG